MKKTLLIIAGFLTPLALQAAPGEVAEATPKGEDGRPIIEDITDYDTDGDGKLSEGELAAALKIRKEREALLEKTRAERLAKYDVDKNGKLDSLEETKWKMETFDADSDGVLDEIETEKAEKAVLELSKVNKADVPKIEGNEVERLEKEEAAEERSCKGIIVFEFLHSAKLFQELL